MWSGRTFLKSGGRQEGWIDPKGLKVILLALAEKTMTVGKKAA
jgi:hypothetical protein